MWLIGFVHLVVFVLLPAHETEIEIARATPPNLKSHHKACVGVEVKWGITNHSDPRCEWLLSCATIDGYLAPERR
jgi:hypothetical protein